jgi:hypothetical protein
MERLGRDPAGATTVPILFSGARAVVGREAALRLLPAM